VGYDLWQETVRHLSNLNVLKGSAQFCILNYKGCEMRLSDSLALLRHYYIVRKSGLFEGDYYRETSDPARPKILPLLAHFLVIGGAAGRSPHPLFDSGWYLTQNPVVKAKSANPLVHYLLRGARQGCDPNPYFETKWYLARNKDVAQAGINPLVHYLKHGAAEGRDPSPKFDTQWYVGVYKDVARAGCNPLAHFLRYGRGEGHRAPTPEALLVTSTSNIVSRDDGSLEFINGDPQLHLSFASSVHINQICLVLSCHIEVIEGDYIDPRLYIDYGDGISEDHAFHLAKTDKDHWQALLPMPCLIKTIRLDPSSRRGVIRSPELYVRPVDLRSFFDQLLSSEVAKESLTETVLAVAHFAAEKRGKTPDSKSLFGPYALSTITGILAKTLNVSKSEGQGNYLDQGNYLEWIARYDTITQKHRIDMIELLTTFKTTPLFSVVIPVYNTNIDLLKRAIESVLAQTYPYFEVCIADDASSDPKVRAVIQEAARLDQRIRYVFRPENGHISECSNSALALASGEFVVFLDHDDLIPAHSLWMVAFYINLYPDCQVLFSDEDKIDEGGTRQDPYFKGSFDEYLLYGHNMVSHLGVYRRALVEEVGGFRRGYEGSQDYDLVLRCFEKCGVKQIVHIPHILYHWRMTPGSTAISADQKHYAFQAAKKSINDHFARRGLPFHSVDGRAPGISAVAMQESREVMRKMISVIIPTRDGGTSLMACVNSINKHKVKNIELIIVDNGSKAKLTVDYLRLLSDSGGAVVLRYDTEFNFSKINNLAVEHASGEVLCFLNDDTEVMSPEWLSRARTLLSVPTIGTVGARLVYPNRTIQHFGIHLGLGPHKVAGTPYVGREVSDLGFAGKSALLQQFSAVTAACLFIRREDFMKVGGFEPELGVAYNDVDLCLKIREAGLQVVCDPDIELFHNESKSRGYDVTPAKRLRLDREAEWMRRKWEKVLDADPFFSPNFGLERTDYSLAFPPRVTYPWRTAHGQENPTSRQSK
jgi:glycosyltransferase involved in cell wall biosynthesis